MSIDIWLDRRYLLYQNTLDGYLLISRQQKIMNRQKLDEAIASDLTLELSCRDRLISNTRRLLMAQTNFLMVDFVINGGAC